MNKILAIIILVTTFIAAQYLEPTAFPPAGVDYLHLTEDGKITPYSNYYNKPTPTPPAPYPLYYTHPTLSPLPLLTVKPISAFTPTPTGENDFGGYSFIKTGEEIPVWQEITPAKVYLNEAEVEKIKLLQLIQRKRGEVLAYQITLPDNKVILLNCDNQKVFKLTEEDQTVLIGNFYKEKDKLTLKLNDNSVIIIILKLE